MKPRWSLKSMFFAQAAVVLLLFIAQWIGVLQLHYPRAVENDPLIAPLKVVSIQGDCLKLDDGRTLKLLYLDSTPLSEAIENSDSRIDIEVDGDSLAIFAKERGWICGTPWVALINIPLIPDDVAINRRVLIGTASVIHDEPALHNSVRSDADAMKDN